MLQWLLHCMKLILAGAAPMRFAGQNWAGRPLAASDVKGGGAGRAIAFQSYRQWSWQHENYYLLGQPAGGTSQRHRRR